MMLHHNEDPLRKKLTDIADLLGQQKLFAEGNDSLEKANQLIKQFEKNHAIHLSSHLQTRLREIKNEYHKCLNKKNKINDYIKKLENEGNKGFARLPSFYHLKDVNYMGGVITLIVNVTDWHMSGPDRYEESTSSEKEIEKKFDRDFLEIDTDADFSIVTNTRTIPEKLDEIRDLISDEKLEYEQANERIKNIENNFSQNISFTNQFTLSELKDRSKHVENIVLGINKKLDEMQQKQDKTHTLVDEVKGKQEEIIDKSKKIIDTLNQQDITAKSNQDKIIQTMRAHANQLTEMKQAQSQQTQILHGLTEKTNELKRTLSDAHHKLDDVKIKQSEHTHTLNGLDLKANDLKRTMDNAQQQLSDVKLQQTEHTKTLQGLEQKASDIKLGVEKTNHELIQVQNQQKEHITALQGLNQAAAKIQNELKESNQSLNEVKKQQSEHTQSFQSLNQKATVLQKNIEEGNRKLNEVKQKQEEHTHSLFGLNKKADILQSGMDNARHDLRTIKTKQNEHTKSLGVLNKKADKIQGGIDITHHELKDIKHKQNEHSQNLQQLQVQASTIQKGIKQANESLEEVKIEEKKHTHALHEINLFHSKNDQYRKMHEDFLSEMDANVKVKSDMTNSLNVGHLMQLKQLCLRVNTQNKEKKENTLKFYQNIEKNYATLVEDYKINKKKRDHLFLTVKNAYDMRLQTFQPQSDIDAKFYHPEEYLKDLNQIYSENSASDNEDIAKLNEFYENVIKKTINQVSICHKDLSKNTAENLSQIQKYPLVAKVEGIHVNYLKQCIEKYKTHREHEIKEAVLSLDNGIRYILKLTHTKQKNAKEIQKMFEYMLQRKEELLFKNVMQELENKLQLSLKNEKIFVESHHFMIIGKNDYYEAEQLKNDAKANWEKKNDGRSQALFSEAKLKYQAALKKYQQASMLRPHPQVAEIITEISKKIEMITWFEKEKMQNISKDNFFKPLVTDLTQIKKQEAFIQKNTFGGV